MGIVGGAILPCIFAYIGDAANNIQFGYFVPMFCFAMVAYFGSRGHRTKLYPIKTVSPIG